MRIDDVRRGDIIRTNGGKGIEVNKVELRACSSRGVHINEKYCWDSGAPVSVTRPTKDENEKYFEDQMLDDWSRELDEVRV